MSADHTPPSSEVLAHERAVVEAAVVEHRHHGEMVVVPLVDGRHLFGDADGIVIRSWRESVEEVAMFAIERKQGVPPWLVGPMRSSRCNCGAVAGIEHSVDCPQNEVVR